MNTEIIEATFQLLGTRVIDCKIHNDFIYIDGSEKKKIDISHSISSMGATEDDKKIGVLQLSLKLQIWEGKKKLKIDLTIEGAFETPRERSDENFAEMLEINGMAALYSVARSFVLSITAQSLIEGKVMMPMINFVEYSKTEKQPEK